MKLAVISMMVYLLYLYTVTVTYISGELNMATQIEIDIACEILRTVEKLQLPFILDDITEGRGNCFPLAVIAQCRRKEIFRNLTPELQMIVERNDSTSLRMAVKQFMMTSKHENAINFQTRYNDVVGPVDGRNWIQYWEIMVRNYEWVDYIFVQATAWLLQHDIVIISTTAPENHPYVTVSGNIASEIKRCPFPPLTLGCKSNSHYQSLLPKPELPNISSFINNHCRENTHKQELSTCNKNRRKLTYAQVVMTDDYSGWNEPNDKKYQFNRRKKVRHYYKK